MEPFPSQRSIKDLLKVISLLLSRLFKIKLSYHQLSVRELLNKLRICKPEQKARVNASEGLIPVVKVCMLLVFD